jgi:CheY-specific phosphatase CheX
VDISQLTAAGAERKPVGLAIRDELLEPFITAASTALSAMASTEVVVQDTFSLTRTKSRVPFPMTDIRVEVGLESAVASLLVLSFPHRTAAALAGQILAGATDTVDESLMRDCIGEIGNVGNVVAGQAKALLAGTPYRFAFSLPEVLAGADAYHIQEDLDCLVVVLSSDQGEFVLQVFLKPSDLLRL